MLFQATSLLKYFLPFVIACVLVEAVVLSIRASYDWKAMGVSLLDALLRTAVTVLLPLSIAAPLIDVAARHAIGHIALDTVGAVLLLFIGQEFCYYWYHRCAHRVRWFWCSHAVHHSPNELTLGAALRFGFVNRLIGSPMFYVPLVWLGFSPVIVFQMLSLNLLYQFWIHATWIPRLGPLEYILNTPSSHRAHHAANLEYLDANYGGVLIVFDRLFGTYRAERDDLPCRYGLVEPLTTYNPVTIEFHQWVRLWADLRASRSVREVVGYLLMPPGWRADGHGARTEDLRAAAGTGAEILRQAQDERGRDERWKRTTAAKSTARPQH